MAQAETNRARLRYGTAGETVFGEIPSSPATTRLRFVSETLAHIKQTVVSNEVRDDRMQQDVAEVGVQAQGDINFELTYATYDTFFEHAMCSAFIPLSVSGVNLQIVATGNKVIRATGSWASSNFKVGIWVKLAGFTNTANNTRGLVSIISTTTNPDDTLELTLPDSGALVNEASTAGRTVTAKYLRNGTTKKSLFIEREYTDLSKFVYFHGMRTNQMSLAVVAGAIITGTLSFTGKQGVPGNATSGGSESAANSNPPMTASASVSKVYKEGAAVTFAFRSLNMTLNNNTRYLMVVGQKTPVNINLGQTIVSGRMEIFFDGITEYQEFINHETTNISFRVTDVNGKIYTFTIPRFYWTAGNPTISGANNEVILPLDFVAVADSATSCVFQIDDLS